MPIFSFAIERDGAPVGSLRVEAHNLGLALAALAVADNVDPDQFAEMARRHRLSCGAVTASSSSSGTA